MEKLLHEQELADQLGVKRRTIKTLRQGKKIPCVWLGDKTIRYRRSAVEAALAKLEVKAIATRAR